MLYLRLCYLFLGLSCGFLLSCSHSSAQKDKGENVLVITKGGVYSGSYRSLDSTVPCVRIATTEPVQLVGCVLAGAGDLIISGEGADLVVRNCRGYGLEPSRTGVGRGRFVNSYRARRLWIEHNYLEQTGGLNIDRWSAQAAPSGAQGQPLLVRYNQARNIDGRWRGNSGSTRASFVLLNTVRGLSGVQISYNEVRNTANQSLVEDNINLYASSGVSGSPLRVHNNFVFGAYPFPATAPAYTGTGMTTDGNGNASEVTAYVEAYENQFVSTCNAAMNIAAGHDIYYHDNRLVTSGQLADGTRLPSTWAGTAIFNYYNLPSSVFYNNRVERTVVGYMSKGGLNGRLDVSPGACANCGVQALPNPVTVDTERGEEQRWQQKLQQQGITVGPEDATTPTPTPTPTPPTTAGVVNPSFDDDNRAMDAPTGWSTWTGNGTQSSADYTETYPDARTGTYHGTHYRPGAYEVYTYQTVTGLTKGTYTLRAWVKSGGGQNTAQLQAKNYGGSQMTLDIPKTAGAESGAWVQLELKDINVTNGQCEIGFYSNVKSGGKWLYFDDVELVASQAAPTVPANAAPFVSLSATTNSLTLGSSLVLQASASDADGSVRKVEFFNGDTKIGEDTSSPYQLSWTPVGLGTLSLKAVATDDDGATTTSDAVSVTVLGVVVIPSTPSTPTGGGANLVVNPSFEADGQATQDPKGWLTWVGNGTQTNADYVETYPGGRTGNYHGTHYRPGSYEVYTYQTIRGLAAGTYTLRAWVKSGGGQSTAQLQAKNYGGSQRSVNLSVTNDGANGSWQLVELKDINVSNGECEIGFYSDAKSGGQWIYFDDVEFVAQTTGTKEGSNTVLNASFDDNPFPTQTPSRWSTTPGSGSSDNADYTEIYPGAHSGLYHATHYRPEAYEVYTYQTVTGLSNGTYTLRVWTKSTGGQNAAQLQAKNYGGSMRTAAIGASNNWTQVEITGIQVTKGQCEVGIYSKASGGQWIYFDDIELVRVETSFSVVSSSGLALADNLSVTTTSETSLAATNSTNANIATISEFSIFPNPADILATVAAPFERAGTAEITIVNVQGQVIAHETQAVVAGGNHLPISTAGLPNGTYILRINNAGQRYNKRLIVKH